MIIARRLPAPQRRHLPHLRPAIRIERIHAVMLGHHVQHVVRLTAIVTADRNSGSASTSPSTLSKFNFPNVAEFTFAGVRIVSLAFNPSRAVVVVIRRHIHPDRRRHRQRQRRRMRQRPRHSRHAHARRSRSSIRRRRKRQRLRSPRRSVNVAGETVTPAGSPATDTLTVPLNPFTAVAVTAVPCPSAPDVNVMLVG